MPLFWMSCELDNLSADSAIRRKQPSRGCLAAVVSTALIVVALLLSGYLVFANRVGRVIPTYPNTLHGERRDIPNDTVSLWLAGDQFIAFQTYDSPSTVRAWYEAQLAPHGWYKSLATMQEPCYVLGITTRPGSSGATQVVLELQPRPGHADSYSPPCP